MTPTQKKKKTKGLCITLYCTNNAKRGNYCYKCRMQRWRENNPMKAAYFALRDNAKRRKKEFDLTFEQFKKFAQKVNLIKKRDKEKYHWHIDRIDESKGYTIDNIQVLTNANNLKKYFKYCRMTKKGKFYIERIKRNKDDVPF